MLDSNSLYSPTEGHKEFSPQELVAEEPDLIKRQDKIRRITEKMQNVLSPVRIGMYVEQQLGEKKQLRAAQFPLYTEEDFIKIIYIRLYGQRKNMKYKVEPLEEIQVGGYRFTDFMIRRKS